MDSSILEFIGVTIAISIIAPVAYQFVNNVSGRIQGSRLQEQINENNAINNTSVSGVAGTESTQQVAQNK